MKKLIFFLCQVLATTAICQPVYWTGTTSPNWNTATNWSTGSIPGTTTNVIISSGTPYIPAIAASASGTARNLVLNPGATIIVNNASFLNIKGDLKDYGSLSGNGTLVLDGSAAQTMSGNIVVQNMVLNNSAGATIETGAKLIIKNTLTIASGNLATHDSLVLYSDSAATARLTALPTSGASISGHVTVMQYIAPGYRRYRFWSHPFSNYIELAQLENNIDITGPGGSTNGFTTTSTNAPSAFRYNPFMANDSLPIDPGWRAFTSAYGAADSNRLHRYQGARLFMRGARGEGLGYSTYSPSATTIAQSGSLNQGAQSIAMSKGIYRHQDYNVIGNPYASPVDIGTIINNAKIGGMIAGSAFYIWNPFLGVAGQIQILPINTVTPSPYYLQANNAFYIRAAHNGDLLNFHESDKGIAPSASLLKTAPDYTLLTIYDVNDHPWDMLYLNFSPAGSVKEDDMDATKLSGTDFSFYSRSADNSMLALDARSFQPGETIPLGINTHFAQDYIIKADNLVLPTDGRLYLIDKYLKQTIQLKQGTEYRFSVTADKITQGETRFELKMESTDFSSIHQPGGLQVTLAPNPATDVLFISFKTDKEDNVRLRVIDLSGISYCNQDLGPGISGKLKIPINELAPGIYMVELTCGEQKIVQRLIKE